MYYNKVEISGVNTSQLKVLKESEKTELLKKIKDGDRKEREIPTICFRWESSG